MGKIKQKTPLIKTKLAKEFDYEDKLDIPNPYRDKGKTQTRGNKELLNPRKKKEYDKFKDYLRVLDLEYMLGKKKKKATGGIVETKKKKKMKKPRGVGAALRGYGKACK